MIDPKPDPHFVVRCLDSLLPQLAVRPYQEEMLGMVKPLCEGLKQVGSLLEANYKDKLDELVNIWTEMCKDSSVDIVTRLRALEIIELRTCRWRASEKLRQFYQERIIKFEKKQQSSSISSPEDSNSVKSTATSNKSKLASRPEPERFQTSIKELFPDTSIRERQCILVDGVKLFISSASPKLLQEAKQILKENLVKRNLQCSSAVSNVRYSRDDLLSLSRSPPSSVIPIQWNLIVESCPEIVTRMRTM